VGTVAELLVVFTVAVGVFAVDRARVIPLLNVRFREEDATDIEARV
jgi:hypothetical protein